MLLPLRYLFVFVLFVLFRRTHSWCSNTCARPQLGILCRSRLFQWALCAGMHWAHHTPAWTDLVDLTSLKPYESDAKRGLQYVLERNFGEMEFDWENQQLIVRVLSRTGKSLISTVWPFSLLSGTIEPPATGLIQLSDYEKTYQRLLLHNVSKSNDWICINHRGIPSLGAKLFGVMSPISVAAFIIFLPLHVTVFVLWTIWRLKLRQNRFKMKLKKP
jgi:hypothetical protein